MTLAVRRLAGNNGPAGVRTFEYYASLNALGFYEALGFRVVQPINVPMPGSLVFPSVLMRRNIRGNRQRVPPALTPRI